MKIFGLVWFIEVYRLSDPPPPPPGSVPDPVGNLPGNIWPIDGPKSLNVFLDNHVMVLADRGRCGDNLAGLADRWQHEVARSLYYMALVRRQVLRTKGMFHKLSLEVAQSEQDVSPFCKESDMTYS